MKHVSIIAAALLLGAVTTAQASDSAPLAGDHGSIGISIRHTGETGHHPSEHHHGHSRGPGRDRDRSPSAIADEIYHAAGQLHAAVHDARRPNRRGPVTATLGAVDSFRSEARRLATQARHRDSTRHLRDDFARTRAAWEGVRHCIIPLIFDPAVSRAKSRVEQALARMDELLHDHHAADRIILIHDLSARISALAATMHASAEFEARRVPYGIHDGLRYGADRLGNVKWEARDLHERSAHAAANPYGLMASVHRLEDAHRKAAGSVHCFGPAVRRDYRLLSDLITEIHSVIESCAPRPVHGGFVRG